MKKLLIILLCLPLLFSCGDKIKKKENSIKNSTKEESINLNKQKLDNITEQFKSDLKQLSKATNNKDWNTVLDMTYPKLLDYVTKEELIKEFESIFLLFKDFQSKLVKIL